MPMRPGQLRQRVDIEEATESRDVHGGVTRTWRSIGTRWASIEPLTGREAIIAQQLQSRVTHRIRMRYCSDLTSHHRLVHAGRTFYVVSVVNIMERDETSEAMVEEKVATP